MSNLNFDFAENDFRPLAARMRPTNLEQYYGQTHLLGEGKPLRKAIQAGHVHSMILWGPPGTGKTTLAEIIAHRINAEVERISAVTSGVKEIRESIERAKQNRLADRQTILFVDEVHRFNKSQQDAFLPHIEDGTIIFIGATTENPSFELNNALLSRARVYLLKSLTVAEIEQVLQQAISDPERGLGKERLVLEENLLQVLAEYVNGDARLALNCLELMVDMAPETENGKKLDLTLLKEVLGERQARFDKQVIAYKYYLVVSLKFTLCRRKARRIERRQLHHIFGKYRAELAQPETDLEACVRMASSSPRERTSMDTLATIKAILNDRLDIDPESVTETSTFASLGIDSLDMVELVCELEDQLGIDFGEPEGIDDMAQLVAYVDGLR